MSEEASEDTYVTEAIRWLTSATEKDWFLFVCSSNYDFNPDVLRWMVNSGQLTRAVAQSLYWRMEPTYYCRYQSEKEVPQFEVADFKLIRSIETAWLAGNIPTGTIGFDPSHDLTMAQGNENFAENWLCNVPDADCIPPSMNLPTPGIFLDVITETEDWIEGLPPHVAQIVFPEG